MKTKEPEGRKIEGKWQNYFILIALCFLIYANSLNNVFISDDIPGIVKNPYISSPLRHWLAPQDLLNSLNYLLAGYNPFSYHLTNIILHSLNTILVFIFLSLFFKAEASLLGACLFAVHPIHAEAVTWVSGRAYIITSLFILSSYLLYYYSISVKNGLRVNLWRYALSLIIFSYYVSGSVSFYFIFPFFLILSDITFDRWRKAWKMWLPFLGIFALRIIFVKSVISGRISFVAQEAGQSATLSNPVFNLAYSFFSHLGLLLWPAQLTLYHEPAVISSFALKVELFFLFLIAVISVFFLFRKAKELFFAIGIFTLFLIPTYSPVIVSWLVAERYLYFPSVALSIFLAFFYERIIVVSKRITGIALLAALFIIAAMGVRAVARNEDWKTAGSLWRRTVLVSYNSPRAHNNMGDAYCQEGNLEGGIMEFKKAIELKPDYADAYHNLANVYHNKGDFKEAIWCYRQAVIFNPRLFESHYNLGLIYMGTGELDAARFEFEQALQIRPEDVSAQEALGMVMRKEAR